MDIVICIKEEGIAGLCETKVLASGGDGSEDLLSECVIAFIFGKIKFYSILASIFCQEGEG